MAEDLLIDRYRRGERGAVWHHLRRLGDRVRGPEHEEQARAVCEEMAHRARRNVELLVSRLQEQGYRFHTNDEAQQEVEPWAPASPGVAQELRTWAAGHVGALPLTLEYWAGIVGDVWLVGTHPQWADTAAADPFVLEPTGARYGTGLPTSYFEDDLDLWREQAEFEEDPGVFVLPLAPDHLHKANISGGAPYGIRLPDACADGVFVGEVAMPFVDYLNRVFSHGGFPRSTSDPEAWRTRRGLAAGMLPL